MDRLGPTQAFGSREVEVVERKDRSTEAMEALEQPLQESRERRLARALRSIEPDHQRAFPNVVGDPISHGNMEGRKELVRRTRDPFLRTPSVDIGPKIERLGSKPAAVRERPQHERAAYHRHHPVAGADACGDVNLRAMAAPKIRILVAKPGLDGHDRGAKIVARALRDAGFEVVYTGLHQTPEMIAITAVQEDVDAVGLSIMSGAHNTLFPAVLDALEARGADDILVFGGGIIPEEDVKRLLARGVGAVFTPGAPLEEIVTWIRTHVKPRSLEA